MDCEFMYIQTCFFYCIYSLEDKRANERKITNTTVAWSCDQVVGDIHYAVHTVVHGSVLLLRRDCR